MEQEGSLFKVPLTTIRAIEPHNNADSLEFAVVYDFRVIVGKGQYKVGDQVIYAPVDSILPQWLEDKLFPKDSKIKLVRHRVRQIKIRGQYSQGLLIPICFCPFGDISKLEDNVADLLEITKYEPPEANYQVQSPAKKRDKPKENPRFHKYNGVDNIKWYPDFFKETDEVVVQEKLHGSNCRIALQPTSANTFWKKIKKFFRMLPKMEYCYGSNNVQLQERKRHKGFYNKDIYLEALLNTDAFIKLYPGETFYGEVIGPDVQKNYNYGFKDKYHFVVFDIKVTNPDGTQTYLNPEDAEKLAKERGFDFVPILYRGLYNKESISHLASGPSYYCPEQKVIEGVVIKSKNDYNDGPSGKKAFKLINPEYLAKDQSDYH